MKPEDCVGLACVEKLSLDEERRILETQLNDIPSESYGLYRGFEHLITNPDDTYGICSCILRVADKTCLDIARQENWDKWVKDPDPDCDPVVL